MKENWQYKKLGEIVDITMGQSPSSETYNDSDGLPFFQGNADFGKIHPTVRIYCISPIRIAEQNDILISVRAPIGAINIADKKCCIGRGLASIRGNKNILSKFIFYFLSASKEKLISLGTGSTFKSIGKDALINLKIPNIEVGYQERIVAELDLLSGIIEKQKQQLKELDTLAQSIFYSMFGDPITNDKGWMIKSLGDVGEIVGGSTPSTIDESNWDGDINWVTPAELDNQLFYGETQRKITQKAASKLTLMPVGTILLSSRAPIGKLAITTVPMYCNQGFKNIICGEEINNVFMYYLLSLTIEYIKALGRGATFKEVSKQSISNYKIILPPLDLQNEFAVKIEKIEKHKEAINKSIEETQKLFDYTMDKYFG